MATRHKASLLKFADDNFWGEQACKGAKCRAQSVSACLHAAQASRLHSAQTRTCQEELVLVGCRSC